VPAGYPRIEEAGLATVQTSGATAAELFVTIKN
jgi:hypothetical protein